MTNLSRVSSSVQGYLYAVDLMIKKGQVHFAPCQRKQPKPSSTAQEGNYRTEPTTRNAVSSYLVWQPTSHQGVSKQTPSATPLLAIAFPTNPTSLPFPTF